MLAHAPKFIAFIFAAIFSIALNSTAAFAQTTAYTSSGGMNGKFQQLSPRTPAIEVTARGTFNFDASALSDSSFTFTLAGAGMFSDLGDLVQIQSQRFVGNRGGALVFQVAFQGANGTRTSLRPVEASLELVNPRTIPSGQRPSQMQLVLRTNTGTVQFELPIQLRR